MTYAYDEKYLNGAEENLGEAFDYAVNVCRLDIDEFVDLFIASGIAGEFEKGNPKYISGLSGTELVMQIIEKAGIGITFPEPLTDYGCSPEYWCGWIVAYYQWRTGRTFRDIRNNIPMHMLLQMYNPLHEASEDKFVDTVNSVIRTKNPPSKLQQQRKKFGYSQRELAQKAGINLRTLQQYELKTKNINKAAVQSILSLANVLGCSAEDLIEYSAEENS